MKFQWLLSSLFTGVILCHVQDEFYSSIDQVAELISMERDFIQSLKEYIKEEETHLEQLKRTVDVMDEISGTFSEMPETRVSNPLNAYKLMKRMYTDWRAVEKLIKMDPSHDFLASLSLKCQHFPSKDDVDGAALGLVRLQETYRLDPQSIMDGKISGMGHTELLTPDESYYLATIAHEKQKYLYSFLWMQHALKELDEGKPAVITKKEILYFLIPFVFQVGDLPLAVEMTRQLIALDPSDQNALNYFKYYETVKESLRRWNETQSATANLDFFEGPNFLQGKEYYEALCRGEGIKMTPRRQSTLFCRYNNGKRNPRLIYAPIKEEDEWDHPPIVRYHNFLSEKEMETIKRLSRPKLKRAGVADRKTGGWFIAEYRVSKSAWLMEEDDPVVSRVNQRIADITGLDMQTAEHLQVANYGIGGHYEPHYDFPRMHVNDSNYKTNGNRIATFLNYMSDVEFGGATVFPDVGAAVQPIKFQTSGSENGARSSDEGVVYLKLTDPAFLCSSGLSSGRWTPEGPPTVLPGFRGSLRA
nr:PREDICTED: prolyl 4-hydroxylase subunit alpha-2-like isoform X3 [Lepisosteus oculatus]